MLLNNFDTDSLAGLPVWGQTPTLPSYLHTIHDESALIQNLEALSQQYARCLALVDKTVWELLEQSAPLLYSYLEGKVFITPVSGEALKTKEVYWAVLEALQARGLKREDALILIGGGSLLDLGGFVASTYLRGIAYHSFPTSLLAMVDASIGGKTGINLNTSKNGIGSFYEPSSICVYDPFLKSLPLREQSNAFAEIIKYALLGDKAFFGYLYKRRLSDIDAQAMSAIIKHCIAMKLAIVRQDPKDEKGIRFLLNLGHTFAHAIEASTLYQGYSHGEAVAIGLVGAALYAYHLGDLDGQSLDAIKRILVQYELPVALSKPLSMGTLLGAMQEDKKASHKHLRLILLKTIGKAYVYELRNLDLLRHVWLELGVQAP
jgi:3-dehydroquinate synthase